MAVGLWPAFALKIELNDVASDRVERQRAYARGTVPLPGTPELDKLPDRLASLGLQRGNAIFMRIFKAESELELWMKKGESFVRLATYPICHWTGTIGPKLREGDKQSPEGFYTVGYRQTRLVGRWQNAFNVGFPNPLDQINRRTGSYILVHGGCSSTGCFAMTDQVQAEIFALADAAIKGGQERFQVHIFPFRMTEANMTAYKHHLWAHTWIDLKAGYDSFERTKVPPRINICTERYHVIDGAPGETGDGKQYGLLRPAPHSVSSNTAQPPVCQIDIDRDAQSMGRQTVLAATPHNSRTDDDVEPPRKSLVRPPRQQATTARAAKAPTADAAPVGSNGHGDVVHPLFPRGGQ